MPRSNLAVSTHHPIWRVYRGLCRGVVSGLLKIAHIAPMIIVAVFGRGEVVQDFLHPPFRPQAQAFRG